MLEPNELEYIPNKLSKVYRGLQLDILNDIVSRVAVNQDITRTADWEITRLYELGVAKEVIKRTVQRALHLTAAEIDRIYTDVLAEDYARYEPIYKRLGKSFIPYRENKQLQQLVRGVKKQTLGEFQNITQSLGFALKNPDGTRTFQPIAKVYQGTLDKSAMQLLSGVYDYNTIIKRTVKELTDSGLRTVDYETGWSNRVEVAARRALMTGFNQVVGQITEDNAEQLGADHFEVTWHHGARPTHQPWQGRVYTKDELVTVCGYGAVDGLKGANCRHDFHPFFPGISKRLYTDEELDRMNAEENTPREYKGKQYTVYEATQRQRKMETDIRRKREEIALLEQGGASEDDILAAKARYHALSNEYAQFSKAMDLPQQRERISVDGFGGVDTSFGKPLENPAKSRIIEAEERVRNEVIPQLKTDTIVPRQAVHRQGTKMYEQRKAALAEKGQYGPAYVTISDEEILQLVNKYKGTGIIKINPHKLTWNNQETIIGNDRIIGICVNNRNGISIETSVFKIHYSKKGIHIVPDYPSKKKVQ